MIDTDLERRRYDAQKNTISQTIAHGWNRRRLTMGKVSNRRGPNVRSNLGPTFMTSTSGQIESTALRRPLQVRIALAVSPCSMECRLPAI
ncbi:MAG: hypothetical protein JSR91_08825 [Proteobacteria bacterium]|nr:hypothetical protein [Pseudomonadota bacterium]